MFIQVEHFHSYQDLWVAKTTEESGVGLGCSSCEEGAQWRTEGRAKHMPMTAELQQQDPSAVLMADT